ncbi:subtilisin-like protein [Gymnopus androsaceus JB14]|uniref:Subtilisin-like protein n=1 Tax=Gymnopus androsaceus JB14 TaxID=1447944 RepID=A0A6A4ILL6_9AGAR|nr:subtilisin-like protein [Gymnopus androsaceus JB14]
MRFLDWSFCILLPVHVLAQHSILRARQSPVPTGFTEVGTPPADTSINLRIGLKAVDNPGLEQKLVNAYAAPSPEFDSSKYLSFSIPVSKANELLTAEYTNFTYSFVFWTFNVSSRQCVTAYLPYSIPATSFAPPLSRNGRTTFYPSHKTSQSEPSAKFATRANSAPDSCATLVPPSCLSSLYGIPTTPATQSSNILGVGSLQSNWAEETDLEAFLTEYRPDMSPSITFTLVSVANGTNPQIAGDGSFEASLDVQYTIGVATDVPTYFISVGDIDTDFYTSLTDLAEYLITADAPPQVVTTSYTTSEGFLQPDEADLLIPVCNAFMQATSLGISLLFASGDDGAGGCTAGAENTTLFSAFPGSCPFVTAVGSVTSVSPEVASNFSTGGFSNFFAQPPYQSATISSYFSSLGSTNEGLYNASGRAGPDVSAQGQNIPIIANGQHVLEVGTSASSPIFASVISLVNDRLIAAGKPVLGFLNPFIYANPQAFFDIVNGSTPGLVPADCPDSQGWSAVEGWDPATGFGTPNFDAILTAAGL